MPEVIGRFIRDVPDYPKPGIMFKDITPLLADAKVLNRALLKIANNYTNEDFDLVVGAESRGFLFGVGVGMLLNKGFVPIRKPGKLPCETYKQTYELEYGTDTLEIHKDAIKPGQRVLLGGRGVIDPDPRLAEAGVLLAPTAPELERLLADGI